MKNESWARSENDKKFLEFN